VNAVKNKNEQPLGIKGLLGLGLDGTDGHVRISRGPNFYLFGGSETTHEKMQGFAVKFSEGVDERGKRIEDLNRRELEEIFEAAGEGED
jgi:hypothetical protein